jgi:hypothetical protein
MNNVTLISTRHDNVGACNSSELCQIIESICPEVIFEEMLPSFFYKYYTEKSRSSLETDAINAYLQTTNSRHIPLDLDILPSEAFFQDHKLALERVERLAGVKGFNYRNLVDRNRFNTAMNGFNYLNSNSCIAYQDAISNAVEEGLNEINDDKLNQAYSLWNENNDRRENEMLQNIHTYSNEHTYDKAVFLLGAGHRKSIINKIQNSKMNAASELNWSIYKV